MFVNGPKTCDGNSTFDNARMVSPPHSRISTASHYGALYDPNSPWTEHLDWGLKTSNQPKQGQDATGCCDLPLNYQDNSQNSAYYMQNFYCCSASPDIMGLLAMNTTTPAQEALDYGSRYPPPVYSNEPIPTSVQDPTVIPHHMVFHPLTDTTTNDLPLLSQSRQDPYPLSLNNAPGHHRSLEPLQERPFNAPVQIIDDAEKPMGVPIWDSDSISPIYQAQPYMNSETNLPQYPCSFEDQDVTSAHYRLGKDVAHDEYLIQLPDASVPISNTFTNGESENKLGFPDSLPLTAWDESHVVPQNHAHCGSPFIPSTTSGFESYSSSLSDVSNATEDRNIESVPQGPLCFAPSQTSTETEPHCQPQIYNSNTSCLSTNDLRDLIDSKYSRDLLLVNWRKAGLSYKNIKKFAGLQDPESTLRGRFRTLTKPRHQRVRKPEWDRKDLELLRRAFTVLSGKNHPLSESRDSHSQTAFWKRVSGYMWAHGGSYQFGPATCKKKWFEVHGIKL